MANTVNNSDDLANANAWRQAYEQGHYPPKKLSPSIWFGDSWFQLIVTVYGPYAFGVTSLLVLWYLIVGPQLDRQALDFKNLQQIATSLETTAKTLESTARVMDDLTKRIERMEQR
jgi:hypothetical protein